MYCLARLVSKLETIHIYLQTVMGIHESLAGQLDIDVIIKSVVSLSTVWGRVSYL